MFINAYVEELCESEHVCSDNKRLRVILYAKYENSDLHKVMETKFRHLTMIQHNELMKLLEKFE